MAKIQGFLAKFVLLCCISWTAGKLINPQATLIDCTTDNVSGFCADCLHQIVCSTDDVATIVACPDGQVCGEIGSTFSSCFDPLDVPACDCPVSGVSVMPDAYDDEKFVVCLEGSPNIENCTEGSIVNGETGRCEALPVTTALPSTTTPVPIEQCPGNEFAIVAVTCSQYRYCLSDGRTSDVQNCNVGEIFNTDTDECQFYYPFNCTGKTDGYYTDTQNCNVYHLCLEGEIYGSESTCPEGEYFDNESKLCGAEGEVECNAIKDCGICPDDITFIKIDCTSYYQCEENTDEATLDTLPYVPVLRECPSGTCFDADTTFCNFF